MQTRGHAKDSRSSDRPNQSIFDHHQCAQRRNRGAPKKFSSTESRNSMRSAMQFMSNKLRCRWTTETQIVPYMSTMSELLIDVCEQLATAKIVTLTDQQQTKIHRLRHPPKTAQVPFSPSPFSRSFSTAHTRPVRQQTSPSEVNCILSSPFASSSR